MTGDSDLYGAVACVGDDHRIVLFNRQGKEISRVTLFDDINWNDMTDWIKRYNGQTVYFEADPYKGMEQNITIIP